MMSSQHNSNPSQLAFPANAAGSRTRLGRWLPSSIAARLNLITVIVVIVMIMLGATFALTLQSLQTAFDKVTVLNKESEQANLLFREVVAVSQGLDRIVEQDDLAASGDVLALTEDLLSDFSTFRSTAEQNDLKDDLAFAEENEPLMLQIRSTAFDTIAAYRGGDVEGAQVLNQRVARDLGHISEAVNDSAQKRERALNQHFEDIDALERQLLVFAGSIFALGTVLVFGLNFTLARVISHRLNTLKQFLAESAQRISQGDYSLRFKVTSRDEISQVEHTFNAMSDTMAALVTSVEQRADEAQTARAAAERSDQVKSAFLASMSHELRTPLNAVINFTRFVMDGDTGPVNEQQIELLGEVVGSAKHLLSLINDVLDMSKIESGSLNLFIEEDVSLNALLTSVVTTGQSLLKDKSAVALQTSIDENLPNIHADRQRILQILLNIMSNACKFTDEGSINVTAKANQEEIVIAVADTGPGIEPDDKALVFEPFKQTKTGLRQAGGTGLGMPIAKNLTEAHGGRLWLESQPGQGTTFYVALPIKSTVLMPTTAL